MFYYDLLVKLVLYDYGTYGVTNLLSFQQQSSSFMTIPLGRFNNSSLSLFQESYKFWSLTPFCKQDSKKLLNPIWPKTRKSVLGCSPCSWPTAKSKSSSADGSGRWPLTFVQGSFASLTLICCTFASKQRPQERSNTTILHKKQTLSSDFWLYQGFAR